MTEKELPIKYHDLFQYYRSEIYWTEEGQKNIGRKFIFFVILAISLVTFALCLTLHCPVGAIISGIIAGAIFLVSLFLFRGNREHREPLDRIDKLNKHLQDNHSDKIPVLEYYKESVEKVAPLTQGIEISVLGDMLNHIFVPVFSTLITIAFTFKNNETGEVYFSSIEPAIDIFISLMHFAGASGHECVRQRPAGEVELHLGGYTPKPL